MKVAIYSRTPLAAAPWELFKALRKYADLQVELVNEKNSYSDGRVFPYSLLLSSDNGTATMALKQADVWHVNNYLTQRLLMLKGKQRIIAQFHSLPRLGNWKALMSFAHKCYTIDQPLHIQEYGLPALPNIIDPDEYRPERRESKIKIAFAPSTKAPIESPSSKGYNEVKNILDRIARKKDVEIIWIEHLPYEENLKLKQQSHILIDDVVTGNWHRTALEGACFGCCVVSSYKCKHFYYSNLKNLERDLLYLIEMPFLLTEFQERSRLWVLREWHAMDKVKQYVGAYEKVVNDWQEYISCVLM